MQNIKQVVRNMVRTTVKKRNYLNIFLVIVVLLVFAFTLKGDVIAREKQPQPQKILLSRGKSIISRTTEMEKLIIDKDIAITENISKEEKKISATVYIKQENKIEIEIDTFTVTEEVLNARVDIVNTEETKENIVSDKKEAEREDVETLEFTFNEETTEQKDVEVEWDFEYTQDDVYLLGDLMYAEEGVLLVRQPYELGKQAHILAGSVVLHRLNDGRWGDSIKEVIFEGNGYAQTTRDKINNIETPEEIYEWAEELLRNGPVGPRTLVFQAQFKQGVEVYEHIDNQYFCLMSENA